MRKQKAKKLRDVTAIRVGGGVNKTSFLNYTTNLRCKRTSTLHTFNNPETCGKKIKFLRVI